MKDWKAAQGALAELLPAGRAAPYPGPVRLTGINLSAATSWRSLCQKVQLRCCAQLLRNILAGATPRCAA